LCFNTEYGKIYIKFYDNRKRIKMKRKKRYAIITIEFILLILSIIGAWVFRDDLGEFNSIWALIYRTLFLIISFTIFNIGIKYLFANKNEIPYFLLLFVVAIFISTPFLLPNTISGHDIEFHYGRIYGIRDGLLDGELFIKLQQNWFEGHGYIVGAFYGDFLLYIPAMLSLFTIKMQTCYQLFGILINILTLFVSYFSFKGVFHSEKSATLGAIMYSCSVYRLMNVYLRHAVGEYCALMFMPLIVLGFYKVFSKRENNGSKLNNAWLILSIAFAGLINTHVLSCEIIAIFIIMLFVLFYKRFKDVKVWKYAGLTVITTLLLSMSFIVPFIDGMFMKGNVRVCYASRNHDGISVEGVLLPQFFELFPNAEGFSVFEKLGLKEEMPLSLGLGYMVAFGFCVFIVYKIKNIQKSKMLTIYSVFAVIALTMSTAYFPWDKIAMIPFLANPISSIQFPWRFSGIASLFVVLALLEAVTLIQKHNILPKEHLYLALVSILGLMLISSCYFLDGTNKRDDYISFNNKAELNFIGAGEDEYLPVGTDAAILKQDVCTFGGVKVTNYVKDGLYVTFDVSADAKGQVTIPMFCYWYYKALLNGEEITVYPGENKMVTVDIPENTKGSVEIFWENPWTWNVSFLITFLSCIGVLLLIYINYKKDEKRVLTI